MIGNNAKIQAWGAWGTQNRSPESSYNSDSQTGIGGDSERITAIPTGAIGEDRKTTISPWTITGGIVAQLIQEAEDQLGNAEECLTWYERERQKALSKLNRLRELEIQLLRAETQNQ